MTKEITITALKAEAAKRAAEGTDDLLIIRVEGATPEPEFIINPKVNIEAKLKYFTQAYNEDFTLKAKPEIRVVGFAVLSNSEMVKGLQL